MAVIKPFRALRPHPALTDRIADLPYDVMNTAEARVMVAGKPYSFLRIDRAEVNFPTSVDPYQPQVYAKANSILKEMTAQGHYLLEPHECFYIYRQIMGGRSQTGLVCTTAVDDYLNDVIKKHEHTRPEKEIDRANHIETVGAHTGPILQTYPDQEEITAILEDWADLHQPVYQFTAYGVEQICWVIADQETIAKLQALLTAVPHIYIADGHHRSAAALRVALKKRREKPGFDGSEEFNYFLSVLFPASQLKIMAYNRVVRDLGTLSDQEFLSRIQERFDLAPAPVSPYEPEEPHQFGMYFRGQWYKLTAKAEFINECDPVNRLDAAILQNNLLSPVLGIADPAPTSGLNLSAVSGGLRNWNAGPTKTCK